LLNGQTSFCFNNLAVAEIIPNYPKLQIGEEMKNKKTVRHGLATVELLIAMPIMAIVFAALMFLAHASYKTNDDFSRQRSTLMSRHTLKPPQFEQSKTTLLNRLAIEDSENIVKNFFPATESWTVTASQPLDFKPPNFASVSSETAGITGMIYKGTGSPEYRTADLIAPAQNKVEQLGISIAAKAVGKELGEILDAVDEFKNLLTAIESIEKAVDVDIDDVMNQAKQAGKQAVKQLAEFVKEEAKEMAKAFYKRDWDKIKKLRKQIKMIRAALKQLGVAEGKFGKIADAAENY